MSRSLQPESQQGRTGPSLMNRPSPLPQGRVQFQLGGRGGAGGAPGVRVGGGSGASEEGWAYFSKLGEPVKHLDR